MKRLAAIHAIHVYMKLMLPMTAAMHSTHNRAPAAREVRSDFMFSKQNESERTNDMVSDSILLFFSFARPKCRRDDECALVARLEH